MHSIFLQMDLFNLPLLLQKSCIITWLTLFCYPSYAFAETSQDGVLPGDVQHYFDSQEKIVLTFIGYSGAGYENKNGMLEKARTILSTHNPKKTIVNIGATEAGIGTVYEIARKMGFATTGIVSTQAKKYNAKISPYVETVYFVEDETWGGFMENTKTLSPTSLAMVQCSNIIVGIGGGSVGRDEMIAARQMGKTVMFFPAEMNHKIAIDKARKKETPVPADFKGAVYKVFSK